MSRNHNYQQHDAPGSPGEDSESDVDMDLQELDPATANRQHRVWRGSHNTNDDAVRHIPLRSLRRGRTIESWNYDRRPRTETVNRDGEEDLRELLQEDGNPRDSPGSVEDSAPLLSQASSGRPQEKPKAKGPFSSHLRFPRFHPPNATDANSEGSPEAQSTGASRNISIGQYPPPRFPPNAVSNAKYTPWSFLPRTLYNEFSFFFNMYFLLVALSQIIPPLRIGYLSTYVAPLAFVLTITLGKEALDDIARRRRDNDANKEEYTVLRLRNNSQLSSKRTKNNGVPLSKMARRNVAFSQNTRLDMIAEEESNIGDSIYDSHIEMDEIKIKSRDLKVGDVLRLGKDQRVPADLVILKSYVTESPVITPALAHPPNLVETANNLIDDGTNIDTDDDSAVKKSVDQPDATKLSDNSATSETFIRTDQLDGETDWKLRLASSLTQSLDPRAFTHLKIVAGKPDKKINEFVGTVEYSPFGPSVSGSQGASGMANLMKSAPLTIDNTAWANTVLASSATVLAVVVYTGAQTRQALSTSPSRSKTGLLEYEINNLTKILCALTLTLSVVLVALEGFENRENQKWYVAITRFLILFSTIIPISLRVNLDMGKSVYAWFIERDQDIPDTVVRTSTIPEELGRIEYLLSDKTGTLTQNGESPSMLVCTDV